MSPLLFNFWALPPEVNSALLTVGASPALYYTAATAYWEMSAALSAAAAASDGSMANMSVIWRGPTADKAQAAFRNHNNWLRTQSEVAGNTFARVSLVADANVAALASMPKLPIILAVQSATATLVASNGMGQNTPLIAIGEAAYAAQWIRAAVTMTKYAAEATTLLTGLQPPAPSPTIVNTSPTSLPTGGGGGGVPDLLGSGAGPAPVPTGGPVGGSAQGGGSGGGSTSDPGTGGPGQTGGNPGQPGGNAGQPGSGAGQPNPNPVPGGTDPAPSTPGASEPTSPIGELPGGFDNGATSPEVPGLEQPGFYGTSPSSTTLAELNGGGSPAALTMVRGGLGTVPGAATGFRLPATWTPLGTQAFGAGTGGPSPQPLAPSTAPRRASAPAAQLRRRRREEERKSGKAFAPGDSQDMPLLEQPPAIGVIEYTDSDSRPESASEQLLAFGVLEHATDDSDPEFESATPRRPR